MTGLPAALSALALAYTARVADSVMAAMRREMRRCAGGSSDRADSDEETAVMRSIVSKTGPAAPGCTGAPADVGCAARRSRTLAALGQSTPPPACPGSTPRAGCCRGEEPGPIGV